MITRCPGDFPLCDRGGGHRCCAYEHADFGQDGDFQRDCDGYADRVAFLNCPLPGIVYGFTFCVALVIALRHCMTTRHSEREDYSL